MGCICAKSNSASDDSLSEVKPSSRSSEKLPQMSSSEEDVDPRFGEVLQAVCEYEFHYSGEYGLICV